MAMKESLTKFFVDVEGVEMCILEQVLKVHRAERIGDAVQSSKEIFRIPAINCCRSSRGRSSRMALVALVQRMLGEGGGAGSKQQWWLTEWVRFVLVRH